MKVLPALVLLVASLVPVCKGQYESGNLVTVTEFCAMSNLTMIETKLKTNLEDELGGTENVTLTTESGSFLCRCHETEEALHLVCSASYRPTGDNATHAYREIAIFEPIQNSSSSTGNVYAPHQMTLSFGIQYDDFIEETEAAYYTDTFNISKPSSVGEDLLFSGVHVGTVSVDAFCVSEAVNATICNGSQAISFDDPDCAGEVTCEEEYAPFLFKLIVKGEMDGYLVMEEDKPAMNASCPEGKMTIQDYCAGNLSTVEAEIEPFYSAFFTDEFMLGLAEVNHTYTSPFACSCAPPSSTGAIKLTCAAEYTYTEDWESDWNDVSDAYNITESVVWEKDKETGLYAMSSTGYCQFTNETNPEVTAPELCHHFEIASGHQGRFSACELGGCSSFHCELCNDGLFIASTCSAFGGSTCANNTFPESFFISQLNVTYCDGGDTMNGTVAEEEDELDAVVERSGSNPDNYGRIRRLRA